MSQAIRPSYALHQVMLAERRTPSHEYYAAILNDRASQGPVLVTSRQGGMNIEEVAASDPSAIITTPIDFESGLSASKARELADKLGFAENNKAAAAKIFQDLYKIFKDKDATQIEINPLAETEDGHVLW
jgi:succinyl-CoA synthetase beta subunit